MHLETHMTFSKVVLIDSQVIRTQEADAAGCQTIFDILRPNKAEFSEAQERTETDTGTKDFIFCTDTTEQRTNCPCTRRQDIQMKTFIISEIYSVRPINQHVKTMFPVEYLHTQMAQ